MSEKYIPRLDRDSLHEKVVSHEHQEHAQTHRREQAEKARQEKSAENLTKIQELAQAEAKAAQKITAEEQPQGELDTTAGTTQSLKAKAFERTLSKTQQKLSKPARTFSKLVHSPFIDKVSSVSSQTVARPSGFLSGSICAFLGSSIVYYYAKHYGFRYNYLLLILFFIAGYLLGVVLELVVWLVYTRKQRY